MSKKDLGIFAFFLFLVILVTFPAVLHLTTKIIGDTGDTYQFLGFQYIAQREFFAGRFPLGWTDFWRYPYGIHAESIMDSSLFMILGLLWYQFFTSPLLVYNLSVLSIILVNLIVVYLSFRMFFGRMQSLIAAVIYGLSFYSIGKLGGHINLYSLSGFSLLLFSIVKLHLTNGQLRYFLLGGLSLILIAFSSLQYPLFFVGSLPFVIPLALWFFRTETKPFFLMLWQKKTILILTLGMVLGIFMLFHGQKLQDLTQGEVPMPVFHIITVPLIDFLVPNTYLKTLTAVVPSGSKEWIDYSLPFGYVEFILLILAIIFLKKDRSFWFLTSATLVIFILALGVQEVLPQIWPYQYLFPHFPYRGITEPARYFILYYLFATVLIIRYLSTLQNKKVLLGILALLVIQRIPIGFQLSPSQYDAAFIEKVKEPPSKAILDLPVQIDWWNGQMYDIYSVYYDKPIVNGYVQWSGNLPESQTFVKELEPYTCYPEPEFAPQDFDQKEAEELRDRTLRMMRFSDIRTVVLHKDLNLYDDHCTRAKKYIDVFLEQQDQWLEVYNSETKTVLWLKD